MRRLLDRDRRRRAVTAVGAAWLTFAGSSGATAWADGAFPDAQTVLLPTDRPQQIVLATNFGLVFSDDDGAHWQYGCETRATTNGRLYALGPAPEDRLFALSDYGIASSSDDGCSWRLGSGPFEGGLVLDYFLDPIDANHVLAVARPPAPENLLPAQVFESHDGGLDYGTVLHPGIASGGIAGVEIARSDPRVIYVALFEASAADTATHPRLARTADAGASWETIDLETVLGPSRVTIAAVDPSDADRLYLRVSGIGGDGRSVDAIAVSPDGGHTFARPVNLTGGKLMTFIATGRGTVLVAGLLGATAVGYRSLDRGATFASWSPRVHPKGFGARGDTLFVATDQSMDGFALASSEDDGDTWAPRMSLPDVQAIRGCVQKACVDDCWQKVSIGLWSPPVCGPADPVGPDGGVTHPNRSSGCSTAGATGDSSAPFFLLALLVVWRAARRRRVALAICAAVLTVPGAAQGYVQQKTSGGRPMALPSGCLRFQVHLDGLPGVDQASMRAAVTAAARAWTAGSVPCTSVVIELSFAEGPGPLVGNDGTNVIGARSDGWCEADDAAPTCNSPSATAATSVFADTNGRIRGGDTQLNTLTFGWSVLAADGTPADRQDLQSALTHEIGHLLGFDHPCWSGIGEHAVDDSGNEVPFCYQAPPDITGDTMYPIIDPGDISRRVLSPEAIRAVCTVYPADRTPACGAAESGCSVPPAGATRRDRGALVQGLLVIAAMIWVTCSLCPAWRGTRRPWRRAAASAPRRTWRTPW